MSRNNLILVICVVVNKKRRFFVVPDTNADTEWSAEFAHNHVGRPTSRYTFSRAKALLYAHDLQRKSNTEYGVREMYV